VVITDEDGRFVMSPTLSINPLSVDASGEFRRPPLRLTFADAAVNRIAWGDVDLNAPASALEVTLRSTRPVSVPIQYASGVSTESVKIFWSLGAFVASGRPPTILSAFQDARKSGEGDLVELNCPPGKYRFQVTMQDMSKGMMAPRLGMADVELTVPEGTGAFEAPPARLADPAQQQMIGRAAPEIEATDLDTGQAVKLADFRGKVVVLDFWGYWCGPCVSTMPELAEIQRHFEGKPVVILALHDPTVQSKEEYDRQIKGVKKLLWGDKDIPLQVILDRADPNHGEGHPSVEHGLTIRRYQVRTVPTLFVIDQEGKINGVVHFRDHDGLKARIQGLLDKPPAR
jgi:thiol-disulfide isomerase/thioredoxin